MPSGGGGSSTNNQIVEEQRTQADQAARDERARQERLRYGRDKINAIFRGGTVDPLREYVDQPVYENRTFYTDPLTGKETNVNPAVSPSALSGQGNYDPGGKDNSKTRVSEDDRLFASSFAPGGTTSPFGETTRAVQVGTTPVLQASGDVENFTGIGQTFYDAYSDAIADYYNPVIDRQYADAQEQDIYRLARQGIGVSSAAADARADTAREYQDAKLRLAQTQESQVSQLRSDVNSAETRALNALAASEDPTTGVNTALTEVNAIQSRAPSFEDNFSALFTAPLQAYNRYQDAKNTQRYASSIPTTNPYTSSGANYS